MYCNLRQFDKAREIIPENDIESAKYVQLTNTNILTFEIEDYYSFLFYDNIIHNMIYCNSIFRMLMKQQAEWCKTSNDPKVRVT